MSERVDIARNRLVLLPWEMVGMGFQADGVPHPQPSLLGRGDWRINLTSPWSGTPVWQSRSDWLRRSKQVELSLARCRPGRFPGFLFTFQLRQGQANQANRLGKWQHLV